MGLAEHHIFIQVKKPSTIKSAQMTKAMSVFGEAKNKYPKNGTMFADTKKTDVIQIL